MVGLTALTVALPLALGHRGTHMALNVVLPGAGLFGVATVAAVVFVVATVVAVALWLRWGLDWLVLAVLAGALAVSAAAVPNTSAALGTLSSPPVLRSAHEFPLVLLVVSVLSQLGRVVRRLPPVAAVQRRRARRGGGGDGDEGLAAVGRLGVVDRCRAASIAALAGIRQGQEADVVAAAVRRPDVARRARRVGMWARGRLGDDPFRVDHAHARAALVLTGALDAAGRQRFLRDAETTVAKVPCSEPTWVRPLDAALAGAALHHLGRADAAGHLGTLFAEHLGRRRGHRPAWWWTVLGVPGGSCPAWEQGAATGVARALGAVGDDDWWALRTRALGAAARGTADPHDERLIAAARVWLALVDDQQATPILARPTVGHDPLAVALDRLAARLRSDPDALRRPIPAATMTT